MEYLTVESFDFRAEEIYCAYSTSFPPDEQRSEQQFRALFNNPRVRVVSVLDHLQKVGYLIIWELTGFVFLEHFEIFSEFRSRNYGSQIVTELYRDYSHMVLEAEPADLSSDAARRISFYEKNGFTVIDRDYVQPAYDADKNPLNLWLMANWLPDKTDWIREELYDVVYR